MAVHKLTNSDSEPQHADHLAPHQNIGDEDSSERRESGVIPTTHSSTVLFVDDEQPVLNSMLRFSRRRGWQALTALSGEEALALLETHSVDVVVSDMRMPGMSGDVLLSKIKQQYPSVIRILLTGHADIKALENAINFAGIYNYINKPWDDNILSEVISGALRFLDSERERQRLENLTKKQNRQLGRLALSLDKTVKERTIEIEQALTLLQITHKKSKSNFNNALAVVTHLLDWSEGRANNHCRFVSDYASRVAKSLNLSEDEVELTQQAGLLHDVGLMALPENIRKKPVYEMSPQELDNYEQHPLLAEMALSAAPGLEQVAKVIKQHHERLDGSGFPEGLHAKDISRPARIVAVVADYHDLYHGLLQPHCVGHQDAKVYLQQQSGLAYEKLIVEHFLKLINPEDNPKVKRYRAFVYQLKAGMTLEEDLRADNKLLLLTQGTTITQSIIDRLYCYEIKFKCHFEILIKEAE